MVLKQWYQSSLAYLSSLDTNCTTSIATNLQVLQNPEYMAYSTMLLLTVALLTLPPPCMNAQPLQSCPTLCNCVDCSPPGFICPWNTGVGCHAPSRESSPPRDQTQVSYMSCIGRWVLYHQHHLGSLHLRSIQQLLSSEIGQYVKSYLIS